MKNVTQKIKMLVITSRPLLYSYKNGNGNDMIERIPLLEIDEERTLLREALKAAKVPIEVTFLAEASILQISRALENSYDIVHFTGHGTKIKGELLLEDGKAGAYPIEPTTFRNIFSTKPKILFLSACYSEGTAKEFFGLNIPCIIYLQSSISDKAASIFCQHFYHSIARGKICDEAFKSAVNTVAADKSVGDQYFPKDIPSLKYSQRFAMLKSQPLTINPLFNMKYGKYSEIYSVAKNNVPQLRSGHFFGREEDTINIVEKLAAHEMIALVGEPGIGKSTLLKHIAHWCLDRNKFQGGIYWSSASEQEHEDRIYDLDSLLSLIIYRAHGQHAEGMPSEKKKIIVKNLLQDNPCLLILDNYETLKKDNELWDFIQNVPKQTKVLITSRESISPADVTNISVGQISNEDSILMFISIIERTGRIANVQNEHASIIEIIERLHGWPLAIEITAGQIVGSSLNEILNDLKNEPINVLDTVDGRSGQAEGIWTRLRSSYDRLNLEEKKLFEELSILEIPIEKNGLRKIINNEGLKVNLNSLVNKHLLMFDGRFYSFHPLIKDFAVSIFKETGKNGFDLNWRAFNFYNKENPIIASNHLYECASLNKSYMQKFLMYVADSLQPIRELGLWGIAYNKCLLGIKESRKINHRKLEASFLHQAGIIMYLTGKSHEALKYFEEARTVGAGLGDVDIESTMLGSIGNVLNALGRNDEALGYLKTALSLNRNIKNSYNVASNLNGIGNILSGQDKIEEAIAVVQESLTISREKHYKDLEAANLGALGLLLARQNKYNDAIKYMQDALTINLKMKYVQGAAIQLSNIGLWLSHIGKIDEALERMYAALKIYRDLGGKEDEAIQLGNIGLMLSSQSNYDEALKYMIEALTISREIENKHVESTQLQNIAKIFIVKGNINEGLECLELALQIVKDLKNDKSTEAIALWIDNLKKGRGES